MTLTTMMIGIAIAALVFHVLQVVISGEKRNYVTRYLQAFVGVLFLFSGWVKAVDPLGTAYKMEQYFDEFEGLFQGTWFEFISPMFPVLSEYAISFSVIMIVFEFVLGFMILLGFYKKFATWSLLILVVFFLILTGFTYLTGYVPPDGTFFTFGSWGAFDENNMKVTDCGCFGDFIKLKPFTSFIKDVLLVIPAVLFILNRDKMYTIIEGKWKLLSTALLTVVTLFYCFSNYVWDIPHLDFRPFKEGVDIAAEKERQMEILGNVQVTGFLMQNKEDPSRKMEIKTDEYSAYSDEWEVKEQITSEPIEETNKISEFGLMDMDGNPNEYELFEDESKSVVIISHNMKGKSSWETITVTDTIVIFDEESGEESMQLVTSEKEIVDFQAKESYQKVFEEKVIPFVKAAQADGMNAHFLVAGKGKEEVQDFVKDVDLDAKLYQADDILLKTIIRSNPGIVIMQKGKILEKIHIAKLPSYEEYKSK